MSSSLFSSLLSLLSQSPFPSLYLSPSRVRDGRCGVMERRERDAASKRGQHDYGITKRWGGDGDQRNRGAEVYAFGGEGPRWWTWQRHTNSIPFGIESLYVSHGAL